jgi:hypothetical protein
MASMLKGLTLSLLVPLFHALMDHSRSRDGESYLASRFQIAKDTGAALFELPALLANLTAVCLKTLTSCTNVAGPR